MKAYTCIVCGYDYESETGDPENDVTSGTAWDDVPKDWICPVCGADKDSFDEKE
jgi:rubredoxin